MTQLKALSFLKAYKKLLRKGGYIRRWEGGCDNKKVYFISKQGKFLKGTLLDNGNIADTNQATLNRGAFSESKHWNHYPKPEVKIDTNSLDEVLPIPNTVAELTPIFNSQLNNMCGVGHKKVVETLERVNNLSPYLDVRFKAEVYLMVLQSAIYSQLAVQKTGKEKSDIYKEKTKHVKKLVELCIENGITVGQELKRDMPHPVIFFDLPGCDQITICANIGIELPAWLGEMWDGKRASMIPKIERAIMSSSIKDHL